MDSYEVRKTKSLLMLHGITRQMIADKAGVSLTFVSYVLHGKRKGARVQKIIEDMIHAKVSEPPKW